MKPGGPASIAESRSDKTPHHAGAVNPTIHDPERLQAALRFRESEESSAQSAGPTIADIEEGLAQLADYSKLRREQADGVNEASLLMHRLVQDVTRFHLTQESHTKWLRGTLQLADSARPENPDDVRTWPEWDPLGPHITDLVQYANKADIPQPTSDLMNDLGLLLKTRADYSQAEPLMRRTLVINEKSFGKDHPTVALCLNNLALLLLDTNRLDEAETLMRRGLVIEETSKDKYHPHVAIQLNNLAKLLQATNRLAEAEPLMRRALAVFQTSLGDEHPSTQTVASNYALLRAACQAEGISLDS